jgi:peptidyl-dipeptidase A
MTMNRFITILTATLALLGTTGCQTSPVTDAQRFIAEHEATIRPVEIAANRAWWNAYVFGSSADYKAKEELENKLDGLLSNPERFSRLEKIRENLHADDVKPDALIARQIELLHLQYLEKQVDPKLLAQMSARSNAVEKAFNNYRPTVDGKELTDSEVIKVLKESKDSAYRRKVWEASKGVGPVVLADLKELVKLRNQAARKLGFRNYYDMKLQLGEQTPAQVIKLFDELYDLTKEPFRAAKAEIDAKLAANCGITAAELRPWHYQDRFFQEPPVIDDTNLDALYARADILKLARDFYAGIGLPIDAVLARSDLYEKPGKSPHAFETDIDREGDVRVLLNIVSNEEWMGTTLHELGHATYGTPNIPKSLPYLVRLEAHALTTEGLAVMMEALPLRADWMQAMGMQLPDRAAVTRTSAKMHRNKLLVFAAWAQVMVRFEAAMYDNPDQDLNKLWWDLVEKYQLVHRPDRNAPDYAAKIHICTSPVYYHNYIFGQLFACQLQHTIAREVLKADPKTALFNGHQEVGEFLKTRVFAFGRTLRWDEFIRQATGEELSAKAFAEDVR